MGDHRATIDIPPHPPTVDAISLRNVQLPLPTAPEAWHRSGKRQPCFVSLRLLYSSAIASAAADDVSLSLDYGKLYRRVEQALNHGPKLTRRLLNLDGSVPEKVAPQDAGQDIHITAGTIATCALEFLTETAADIAKRCPAALTPDFGQCEVRLDLPKAVLRADRGLTYRCITAHCPDPSGAGSATVILSEEFRIERIRCHCIIGINPHERVEKQAVVITLAVKGAAADAWRSTFLRSYQEMVRCVAEVGRLLFLYLSRCSCLSG